MAETQFADGVAVNDVQVDLVQVTLGGRKGRPALALANVGKLANGGARLPPSDELRVLGRLAEVLVI